VQLCKDNGGVLREFCPSNHRAGGLCVGSLFLITGTSPTAYVCSFSHLSFVLCLSLITVYFWMKYISVLSRVFSIFDLQTGSELYRMNFPGRLDNSVSRVKTYSAHYLCWVIYCIELNINQDTTNYNNNLIVLQMVQSGKMFTFWDRLYCVDLTNRAVLKAVVSKTVTFKRYKFICYVSCKSSLKRNDFDY
jgi:hypothetical protein